MRRLAGGFATLVAIVVLGLIVFTIWAWRGAIAPITPPVASTFDPALVAKGGKLADAGY